MTDLKTNETQASKIDFRNASGLEFKDISAEQFRRYHFTNGSVVKIDAPQLLHVSASGGHRIFDGAGISHYVPDGWVHLEWKAGEGKSHFDF